MDDNSVQKQPLLLTQYVQQPVGYDLKKKPLSVFLAKWFLKSSMWVVFVSWAAFIFVYPAKSVNELFWKLTRTTNEFFLGITGSLFLVFSTPILLIAILAVAYLILSGEEDLLNKKASQSPRFRLWTFPALVDGPFGIVSAAELIGILLFAVYVILAVYIYTMQILSSMSNQFSY